MSLTRAQSNFQNSLKDDDMDSTKIVAAYGSWKSPISANMLTAQNRRITEPRFDGDTIYFPANTMNAGGHESEITNSVAYHSNNLLKDNNYKIGVRFLGIDAPEIPKYSIE